MKPEERPKIKIQLTRFDQGLELLGWGLLLVLWMWIGTHYSNLPDTIPTHYNANGEADGFGVENPEHVDPLNPKVLHFEKVPLQA